MIKITLAALLTLTAQAPAAVPLAPGGPLKSEEEPSAAWADGRPEDAADSLRYAVAHSSDAASTLSATKDLSVILAELGKNREAVSYLSKAELLAPEDPFLSFEKGWNLLGMGNYADSRAAFQKTLLLTAEFDIVNQARFGLALAETHLGGPSEAASSLQTVYQKYPYLLSPAAEVISAQYEVLKKREHSITFLKEALTYDPRNIQAEIDLARLYEGAGYYVPAWQTYYTLSELDPEDKLAAGKTAGLAGRVSGKQDNLLYWNRMSEPAHTKLLNYPDKNRIRVGLFSDSAKGPAPLTEFDFIANTGFSITDSRLGAAGGGRAGLLWSVKYNPVGRICEITDSMGSVIHTTRNSFRLTPNLAGGVILIKNPEPVAQRGVDRGDREVAGELNVLVKENGFILVNTVPLEANVASIATSLAGGSTLTEELKTLAVLVRSKLLYLKNSRPHEDPDYDICDSPHCLVFPGLQVENESAVSAAEATRDEVLSKDGIPSEGGFHLACGGFTEAGVGDNGRALPKLTPFNLYYLTLKAPPEDLLCLPEDRTAASDVYWTLMLEPKWIENRVNRRAKIGRIRSMTVLKRRPNGKAETLRIEGTSGNTVLEGFDAISRALAAGALRSPLFTMRAVYEGKYPKFFLLRGIGTGDGNGYCRLGGHSMAKGPGAKYTDILKHYFPYYKTMKPGSK